MKECLNYKKISSEILECFNCSHFCRIKEGGTGICGVRQNLGGKLYSLIFGQAAAVNIDPVEKKPLFHFFPGTFAYSFGTLGCNFRCANCQNFDISQISGFKGRPEEYKNFTPLEKAADFNRQSLPLEADGGLRPQSAQTVRERSSLTGFTWGRPLSPEQIIVKAKRNHCRSLAYTYNEPTIFLEYAFETMKLAKKSGIKNIWVSNGFMSKKTLEIILPYLDAVNIDIKSFEDKFYQSNCGARLAPVLANCQRLVEKNVWLEITTLLIPTLSDNEKILKELAKFIKEKLGEFVPWHLSAFSGVISWKLQHLPETPVKTIVKAYQIGQEAGLKYVYAGNVREKNLESTFCPRCGQIVVERIGYQITRRDKDGFCASCGEKIEGIFND